MQKRVINIKKKCMNSFECVFKITLLENTQLLNMEKKKTLISFQSIKDKYYIG